MKWKLDFGEEIKNLNHALSEKVRRHYEKKYNYIEPIKSFFYNRPSSVFITMMVQCYDEIMSFIEGDIKSGKINNPYIVMECNNPKPGLDATIKDDVLRNKYYPMPSRCAVMTQSIADCFNEEIRQKCVIIPNPVRNDLPDRYIGARRTTIVNYCRLNKAKNLPLLIDSFVEFNKIHPEYDLEIYGKGELETEIKDYIKSTGSQNIHLYGFDPHIHNKIKGCLMKLIMLDLYMT